MEMKCYHFKDERVLFKYLYIMLVLDVINMVLQALQGVFSWQSSLNISILYLITIFVIYKKTNINIYTDAYRIKSKKLIPFEMINDINPTTEIIIKADNTYDVINVIDIENNSGQYKELLDDMLSKVSKRLSDTKNSDEILESIKQNRINKYKNKLDKKGRTALDGILAFFNVMAYIVAITSLLMLISQAAMPADVETPFSSLAVHEYTALAIVNIIIIVLLKKRKNSVKYALAVQPIIGTIFNLITKISEFNDTAALIELLPAAYLVIGILINIVIAWLTVKIYIEYIDNFERPKNTLTN